MGQKRKSKKEELLNAAVKLGAEGGSTAATIRAIAREAGVTDAAVYRHYRSKDELLSQAYGSIVQEMIQEKGHLVASAAPFREKLHEWVRLTYAYFDQNPAAFTFVLATPHLGGGSLDSSATGQGELFMEMAEQAMAAREIRPMPTEVAMSHFAGVLLNVPRLINEGTLQAPASAYVEEVSMAAWRIFRPEPE